MNKKLTFFTDSHEYDSKDWTTTTKIVIIIIIIIITTTTTTNTIQYQ